MTEPAYPAARIVAPKVQAHFAHHAEDARRRGRPEPVAAPDADTIEALIDAAFWASLRREESYVPKISLALLPPAAARHPMLFERPLPLTPDKLVKVAPAVERAGIHLGVWRNGEDLEVWGTVRTIPALSIVVEVAAPGLLVVKHHRGTTRASSSTSPCSRAIRSRSSTNRRRACRIARRSSARCSASIRRRRGTRGSTR